MRKNDHTAPLENWIRSIKDVYRLHQKELDCIEDAEDRHRRLVELNVIEQCINLLKTGVVQRSRARGDVLEIHPVVLDIKTGILKRLDVDLEAAMEHFVNVYDIVGEEGAEHLGGHDEVGI